RRIDVVGGGDVGPGEVPGAVDHEHLRDLGEDAETGEHVRFARRARTDAAGRLERRGGFVAGAEEGQFRHVAQRAVGVLRLYDEALRLVGCREDDAPWQYREAGQRRGLAEVLAGALGDPSPQGAV